MKNKNMKHSLKLFICFAIFLYWLPTHAQIKTLGTGLPVNDTAIVSCSDGTYLYVAAERRDSASRTDTVIIWVWNGNLWSHLPKLRLMNSYLWGSIKVFSLSFYRNVLYLAGDFDSAAGVSNSHLLLKYNGTAWQGLGQGLKPFLNPIINPSSFGYVGEFIQYNNRLYLNGRFLKNVDTAYMMIINGSGWSLSDSFKTDNVEPGGLFVFNNKLYMLGSFTNPKNGKSYAISYWNDTMLSYVNSPFYGAGPGCTFKNQIVLFGQDTISKISGYWKFDGHAWKNITRNSDTVSMGFHSAFDNMIEFNGKLWVSGVLQRQVAPYDFFRIEIWNGSYWKFISWRKFSQIWGNAVTFTKVGDILTFTIGTNSYDGKTLKQVGYISNDINLRGKIFTDINSNCKFDSGENRKNTLIQISPGPHYTFSDSTGYFEDYLDSGSYSIDFSEKYH
jgi:hypothetical protein